MKTSHVRVNPRTQTLLREMADYQRRPIQDVLDDAIERYWRALLFEAADVGYQRAGAKRDPDLDAWENTLPDGISSQA